MKNDQPMTLREAWRRGCRVLMMLIAINVMGAAGGLLLYLLPEGVQVAAGWVLLILFGPVICYACFRMFFPEYVWETVSAESDSISCSSCHSRIPDNAETCPKCGWSYKTAQ